MVRLRGLLYWLRRPPQVGPGNQKLNRSVVGGSCRALSLIISPYQSTILRKSDVSVHHYRTGGEVAVLRPVATLALKSVSRGERVRGMS